MEKKITRVAKNNQTTTNQNRNSSKQKKHNKFCNVSRALERNMDNYERFDITGEEIITYGPNHSAPIFLIKLFKDSPTHGSILDNKRNYIVSGGLKQCNKEEVLKINVNPKEDLHSFVNKIVLDYLIFGYYCVKVVPNIFGEPLEFYHIPAQQVATNENKTRFEVKKRWDRMYPSTFYDAYDPKNPKEVSTIYWYEDYVPTENLVYPAPPYANVITSILTEIAITNFNLHNIKTGFNAATIITLFNGSNPDEEIINQQYQEFDNYMGEFGERLMLNFQDQDGKAADIQNLDTGQWADAYKGVLDATVSAIMTGHSVISQALFSIAEAGKLSQSSETEIAYSIWQNTQGENYRMDLLNSLKYLFSESKIPNDLCFNVLKTLKFKEETVDEKLKYMTVDEIRVEKGLSKQDSVKEQEIDEQTDQILN